MKERTLYIKHIVCPRCIEIVQDIFHNMGYVLTEVQLGFVRVQADADWKEEAIAEALRDRGFELLIDQEEQIVNQIKSAIIDLIHYKKGEHATKNSTWLAEKLGISYSSLSRIFSRQEGITIEKYMILQKVERIKELLSYGEFSLKEISDQLGYSSLQHISKQFKSVTGMTVSEFSKQWEAGRISLTNVGCKQHGEDG